MQLYVCAVMTMAPGTSLLGGAGPILTALLGGGYLSTQGGGRPAPPLSAPPRRAPLLLQSLLLCLLGGFPPMAMVEGIFLVVPLPYTPFRPVIYPHCDSGKTTSFGCEVKSSGSEPVQNGAMVGMQ